MARTKRFSTMVNIGLSPDEHFFQPETCASTRHPGQANALKAQTRRAGIEMKCSAIFRIASARASASGMVRVGTVSSFHKGAVIDQWNQYW